MTDRWLGQAQTGARAGKKRPGQVSTVCTNFGALENTLALDTLLFMDRAEDYRISNGSSILKEKVLVQGVLKMLA